MKNFDNEIAAIFMNDVSIQEKLKQAQKEIEEDETYSLEEAKEFLKAQFHKKTASVKKQN